MPQKYKVKDNETLTTIAKANGFNSVDTIVNANLKTWPYLATHPNTLITGMTIIIPDKKAKKLEQQTGTSVTYTAKAPVKQFFTLTLEDHLGEIASVKDDVQLYINGSQVTIKDLTVYDIKPVKNKVIAMNDPLPEKVNEAYLNIKFTLAHNKSTRQQKITLEIGGIDAIMDPNSDGYSGKPTKDTAPKKAVQKMLLNSGCYNGELDGDLEKMDSMAALMRFQAKYMQMSSNDEEFGKPGAKTCIALGVNQGVFLGPIQPISHG